jgi:hypothetical protein
MNMRVLVRRVVIVAVLVAAFVVGTNVVSTHAARPLVPDCNCHVYNWPNPGDKIPGVRYEPGGECYADPCGGAID